MRLLLVSAFAASLSLLSAASSPFGRVGGTRCGAAANGQSCPGNLCCSQYLSFLPCSILCLGMAGVMLATDIAVQDVSPNSAIATMLPQDLPLVMMPNTVMPNIRLSLFNIIMFLVFGCLPLNVILLLDSLRDSRRRPRFLASSIFMSKTTTSSLSNAHPVDSAIAGSIGGICAVLATHPLDLVKVRLQNAPLHASASPIHTFIHIYSNYGIRGLYRGVSAPILGAPALIAFSFYTYSLGHRLASSLLPSSPHSSHPNLTHAAMGGAFSGLICAWVNAPAERIKILMQTTPQGSLVHAIHSLRSSTLSDTIYTLWRGTVITLVRDIPGSALYFSTYTYLRYHFNTQFNVHPILSTTIAGGVAGSLLSILAAPADRIKTRIQASLTHQHTPTLVKRILHEQGWRGFWTGTSAALTRTFPANAACFLGYELTLYLLAKLKAPSFLLSNLP